MDTLDILHPIKAELLEPRHYFESLLRQAQGCGLLSDANILKIQDGLLSILARQMDSFTRGESSSIPAERAQDIMTSVIFVIGVQLKSCETPERAVSELKEKPLQSLFDSGMELVRRKTAVSRRIQKRISDNLLPTPNVYYRSTIVDGIDGFFKMYRPQFAAHEIHITADYPLCLGRPELDGIEFIHRYLRCIEAENAFCLRFDPVTIHRLLCGLTPDYYSVPMNIFEPVLLSALGLIAVNRRPETLDLTCGDISLLYHRLFGRSRDEIHAFLNEALSELDRELELPPALKRYAGQCLPTLTGTVQNAVVNETLDKVFLIPAYPQF